MHVSYNPYWQVPREDYPGYAVNACVLICVELAALLFFRELILRRTGRSLDILHVVASLRYSKVYRELLGSFCLQSAAFFLCLLDSCNGVDLTIQLEWVG